MVSPSAAGLPHTCNRTTEQRLRTLSLHVSPRLPLPLALVCSALLLSLLLLWVATPAIAMPAGFQEYYILGSETQVLRMFEVIQRGGMGPAAALASTITVVATANYQVVYYDHWEDGYEPDILHPVQASTEVYGDGIPQTDILRPGDIIRLTSDGSAGDIHQFVPVPRGTDLRYDGGDRLYSVGGSLDIAHSVWPSQYAWIGGAWEIYPVGAWPAGHSYVVPIGEELYDGTTGYFPDLQHVWLQVQALDDNTTVHVDNGLQSVSVRLNRGQHYSSMGYVDGSTVGVPSISVRAGTTVLANKPIQGGLVTGREVDQTRFYSLVPDTEWGTEYVAPIPRTNSTSPAEVYLYNPDTSSQLVTAYDRQARSGASFTLPARTTLAYRHPSAVARYVPTFSGLRLSSAGPLWAVVSADVGRTAYDWGFSIVPTRYAGQDFYVAWAPSSDGTRVNASPVWVTPLGDNTTFYVDYSAPTVDGIPDQQFMLDSIGLRRIWDPTDGDNTGMHIWADKPFVAVWGEDPSVANNVSGIDIGYPVLPVTGRWLDAVLDLDKSPKIQAVPHTGGIVPFTLQAKAFNYPIRGVQITDTLPSNWTYLPNSASVIYPDGHTARQEPAIIGQALAWPLSADLAPHQTLTVTFQAQFTPSGSLGDTRHDDLESGGYTGGSGWSGPWTEIEPGGCGGNCVYTTTSGFPHSGIYHLAVTGSSAAISRTADLSGFQQPALRFWRYLDSLESTEAFYLRAYDGTRWSTILTLTTSSGLSAYMGEQLDLTPYRSASFALEFRTASGNAADDYLYVDDVAIVDLATMHDNAAEVTATYAGHLFSSRDQASVALSPFDLQYRVDRPIAVVGDHITFSLAFTNSNPILTATNVLIRSVLPANTLFVSASPGYSYVPAANTVLWGQSPSMTLAPGASGTVTVSVAVDTWASNLQVLRSQAYLDCDQTPEVASNPVGSTIHAPALSVTKIGPASANAGQVLTYTVQYANTGLYTATGVIITDFVPISTTYQVGSLALDTGSGFQSLTDADDQDAGSFTNRAISVRPGRLVMGQVGPGESGQIRFSVSASLEAAGSNIANYATLIRDYARPQNSELLLTAIGDLTLAKSADSDVAGPGAVVSYSLILGNGGSVSQTEVYLYETIPHHTHYLPGSALVPPGFLLSYSIDNGLTWTSTLPTNPAEVTNLRWYTPSIEGAIWFALGYATQVEDPLSTANVTLVNRAWVTSAQTPLLYSNEVRLPTVDPSIRKTDQSTLVSAGERITYTIIYSNRGGAAAPGTVICDYLPDNTELVPGSISGPGTSDGRVVTWTVNLPPQSSASVQFAVTVADPLPPGVEVVTNTAFISTTPGFAAAYTLSTRVAAATALSMIKTASAASVTAGELLTYTLLISNPGRQEAADVTITDVLPSVVSFVYASDDGASDANVVTWPSINLEGHSSITRTLTVRLADPMTTTTDVVVNSASATGYDGYGYLLEATATHSVIYDFAPAIRITKNGPSAAKVGETVVFTFTLANVSFTPTASGGNTRGDGSPIHDLVVTDSIASPVHFVGGDDGDDLLEVGEAWTYVASYVVRQTDPDPLENIGTVTGRDANGDPVTASDRHQLDVQYQPALRIEAVGPDTAAMGDIVTVTLTVTNDAVGGDGSAVAQIVVRDSILGDVAYVEGDDGDGLLSPGESWSFSGSHQITYADPFVLAFRSTVAGRDRDGDLVSAECTHHMHVEWDSHVAFLPILLNR